MKLNCRILEDRGWNLNAYGNAWKDGDEDGITINHPSNFMTEDEVEADDMANLRDINTVVAFLFGIKEN